MRWSKRSCAWPGRRVDRANDSLCVKRVGLHDGSRRLADHRQRPPHQRRSPARAGGPDGPDSDFHLIRVNTPEAIHERLPRMVTERIAARFGLDPVRDVQVLTPKNRGGLAARALNVALQAALNPDAQPRLERFGWTFAPGDKDIQLVNGDRKGARSRRSMCTKHLTPAPAAFVENPLSVAARKHPRPDPQTSQFLAQID